MAELLCDEGDMPPASNETSTVNGTVPVKPPGAKAKKAWQVGSQEPDSSPFLAAVRQRAGLRCGGLAKAPERSQRTLDLMAHCGGKLAKYNMIYSLESRVLKGVI